MASWLFIFYLDRHVVVFLKIEITRKVNLCKFV